MGKIGGEFLIRNGQTKEECYLKSIRNEKSRDLLLDYAYGQNMGNLPKKSRKGAKKEDTTSRGEAVATWTEDETQAMYFRSRIEAQRVIDRWRVLQWAKATIVSA